MQAKKSVFKNREQEGKTDPVWRLAPMELATMGGGRI
jgi:hypothetical protein